MNKDIRRYIENSLEELGYANLKFCEVQGALCVRLCSQMYFPSQRDAWFVLSQFVSDSRVMSLFLRCLVYIDAWAISTKKGYMPVVAILGGFS